MVLGNFIEREDSYVYWICNSKTRYNSPLFLVKDIILQTKETRCPKLKRMNTIKLETTNNFIYY